MKNKRLAILTTHPIQYYAPVFRLLAERAEIAVKVFYSWGENSLNKYDPGFGRAIEWDIPLLDGYDYEFLENSSKEPGSHHYKGIVNPHLKNRIEAWQPDALLVIGWNYSGHLQALRYFHGRIPILFRGDSHLLDEVPGWKKIARRLALTWVYRHVDIALYTGTANRKYYEAHGLKPSQLIFAPHAIDNERFSDDKAGTHFESAQAWRRTLGFSAEDIVILFAGKLEPKKGIDLLLASFLQMEKDNLKLLIVGNGPSEETLKDTAAKDARIRFLPFQNQSQMPVVYRLGDIFCLPSRGPGETWGLAVNEAMASGRAILVSDRCGCAADLVRKGENGYIFRSGEVAHLSEKIELLHDAGPEGLSRLGVKSAELVKEWSVRRVVDSITHCI